VREAETDPRSQSGCWQRFRESIRKQRERESGGEREGETERRGGGWKLQDSEMKQRLNRERLL